MRQMRSMHRGLQARRDPQGSQELCGMKTIKVKIDGIETEAEDRTPILNIAQKLGIKIPTLCHHPLLEPYGVCRICTVEVRSGKRIRMVTACNYPATNGIEVLTNSARVRRDRKLILEWMMARCGHVKVIEDLAAEYGITEPRFGRGDDDCILCGLCVRVCSDVVGANVLGFFNRGATREVSTAYGETSDKCIACGSCAYVCPTGAIKIENDEALVREALPLGPLTPIHVPFLQAVPHQPVIDRESCIHFQNRRMQGLREGLRSQSGRSYAAGCDRRRSRSAPSSWQPASSNSIATANSGIRLRRLPERHDRPRVRKNEQRFRSYRRPDSDEERPDTEERRHHSLCRQPGRTPQQVLLPRLLHVRAEVRAPDQGKDRSGCLQLLHRHALFRKGLRGVLPPPARGRSALHPRTRCSDHRFPIQRNRKSGS